MAVFDEKSEEFVNLPKDFKTLVRFVNKAGVGLKNFTASAERGERSQKELEEQLEKSREIIKRQFELIERFVAMPISFAVVVKTHKGGTDQKPYAIILHNGQLRKVGYAANSLIMPGKLVEVSSKTLQIIGLADTQVCGGIGIVRKLISDGLCEIDYQNEPRTVLRGLFGEEGINLSLESGDRVVLDPSATIILANLGKEKNRFKLSIEPKVTWDDIVGLEDAKEKLIEIVELPYTHADLFKHHNKKQTKGVLLLGPPGCGKSMLVEAAASAMAKIHGASSLDSGYIYVKAAELLEELVGRGEKNIKYIFEKGEEHYEAHGYPAIIAIEEPDAVFIKRGTGKSSDVERSMVDAFLAEMNHTRSIVMLATNRADILDPALIRDKRIDYKIHVGRPNQQAAAKIAEINLRDAPLEGSAEELAAYAASELFSDKRVLYEIKRRSTGEVMSLTLAHCVNGAMAANIAEKAKSITFGRDVKNQTKSFTGKKEVLAAIDAIFEENRHIDHVDEVREFVRDFHDDIADIKPLRQSRS